MSGDINNPEVPAEVPPAFARYETALDGDDVATLNALSWDCPLTSRHVPAGSLYRRDEILAFRRARPSSGLERRLSRTVITTFGRDKATANTEFHGDCTHRVGRQSQIWRRRPEGWRIVAANVWFRPAE